MNIESCVRSDTVNIKFKKILKESNGLFVFEIEKYEYEKKFNVRVAHEFPCYWSVMPEKVKHINWEKKEVTICNR